MLYLPHTFRPMPDFTVVYEAAKERKARKQPKGLEKWGIPADENVYKETNEYIELDHIHCEGGSSAARICASTREEGLKVYRCRCCVGRLTDDEKHIFESSCENANITIR